MSTTYNQAAQQSQEQFLNAVSQSQKAVVDAVAAWAKAVEGITPPVPAMPGIDGLPKPEAVVENAFDFAQKLLNAQREFARGVVSAAAPGLEKTEPAQTKAQPARTQPAKTKAQRAKTKAQRAKTKAKQ